MLGMPPEEPSILIDPLSPTEKRARIMASLDLNYLVPPIKRVFQRSEGLSFSARDLLTRLVREDGVIRGKTTNLTDPLWFHQGTCPEIAVQITDVRELLQHGLIEFWKDWIQPGQELYRPSEAGREKAGKKAVADAARSATHYVYQKQSLAHKRRVSS